MAILLTGTTIGGHSAIHAGNLATHGIITTSNIGSYAITSIPTSFSSITVTSSFDTASNDIYASMRVIRNNSAITDGMYIGYGNSGSGITRIFGGGSTTGALVKATDYTYEPGSFRAPIFYDSDNTTYYFDGNSTTSLRTRGSWRSDSSDWDGEYAGKIQYHSNHWYFQSGNFWFFRNAGGANVFQVDQSGNGTFNGDIYLGTRGTWLSSYLNQDVRSSASPTFNNIYADGWFRNNNSYGLYNQAHGNHFYATSSDQWNIAANGSYPQIVFRSGGYQSTIRGYVYADTSNQIGFLNNAGDWSLRTNSSKDTQIFGTLTVGSSGSSDIYMTDTDETTRRIHTNSGRIGFLNSSNNWGAYCDNTGNWFSDHSMRAPIFYDSANTAYYVDPAGTSNIWRLYANDKYHYFGYSDNWDNGNLNGENSTITNVHFQGHPDFWIGAGNTKWYTSVASGHHDLLINTMQANGGNIRGITFTASTSGGSVYRLGRWFSHNTQVGSYLQVDGGIKVGGTTDNYNAPVAKLQVISSTSGSDVLAVDGVNGRLFTVTDDLSDSLFSVNTIAGLPVIEAFADNTVKVGKYGSNSITISNSRIAINSDSVDSNFPFYVGDRSTAGSRYSLTNPGMGFNLADNYAQLQLFGGNGAYIDFVTSSGQDSAGRIMWDGNFNIQGTTYFANNIYTYTLYDRNDTGYYLDMNGTSRLGTLNINQLSVYGNTYLGDGNGDEVHINDILRVGATDSGDAHIFFGEGSQAGSDYGAHLYWDSGYRFTWYTRNAGTDSTLFYYDTNSLSYITWGRSLSMNTNSIDYTGQLHFSGGTRFQSIDTHYLKFRTDATDYGSIQVRDGNESLKGHLGYFDANGFGLLNSSGSWGIRLNPGNGDTILYSGGNWKLTTTSAGISVNGNVYIDQNYGHGIVGLYASTRYQGVFAMGDSYKLSADGTSPGSLYGIAWTHTNVGGESKSGLGHQALFMTNGVTQTAIGTGIWTNGLITTISYGTSANWNTAYSWGNHASAGYQSASTAITTSNIGSQSVSYASTAGSAPNGGNVNSNYDVAVGGGNGLRFWGGSDSYKISMGVGSLYEYGPVTDYSIKTQMNDSSTARGFTWGRISYAPIAALNSTSGDMEVAGYFKSYGYRGNGNVGGTGTASWHPDGIYCGSTMWQYGTMYKNNTGIYGVSEMQLNAGLYLQTYNDRNLIVKGNSSSDAGIEGRNAAGSNVFQIYGNGSDYGFLNGTWAAWDIRKTKNGAMYMNDNNSYYLQTNSTSNFVALNIQGNAVVHAGNIGSQSVSNSNYINSTRDTPVSALQYWQAPGLGLDEAPSGDWHNTIRMGHGSPLSYYSNTLAIRMTGSGVGDIYTQTIINGNRQGWKKHWNDGNHGSGSGLDADLLDGQQGSYYQPASSAITTSNIGSQSVSYASSAGSVAWTNVSSRPTALSQFTNDLGNYGGFLTSITAHTHAISDISGLQTALDGKQAAGSYAASSHTHDDRYYTESESDTRFARRDADSAISGNLVIGNGTYGSSTAYGNSGARLMFSGSDGDAQGNYYIGTNHNDYGGNYSKLELRWHTGIRMGAQPGYGGIRFYDTEDLGTVIFSVGTGDSHVRVTNNLYVGGNLALHAGNYNSYSPTLTGGNASGTWGINVTGSAGSVAWTNVSSRPTALSQFSNDLGNYGGWLTTGGKAADSELLDGIDSGYFVRGNGVNTLGYRTTNQNNGNSAGGLSSGFYDGSGMSNMPTSDWYHLIVNSHYNSATNNQYEFQLATAFWDKSNFYVRSISPGDVGPWRTLIHNGNIGSQSVNYANSAGSASTATTATTATVASQLNKFGDIYGQNWNSYYIQDKFIASAVYGHSGANRPNLTYDYGVMLSYGETSGPLMQMYFPENSPNLGTIFRKATYRTGWNGNWSTWKTLVEQEGNTCTIVGGNQTGMEIHANVGYNQDPLTYFLLRGQADTSWKALKIRLTGDAGGQDIEFRRIAENGADARMFYVPRGANQVIFEYQFVQGSDSRLKDNIIPITNSLDKVKSLRGVEFDWNSGVNEGTHDVGLIAQEVEAVLPEAVTTQEDGYKNLAYTKVIPLLVEAMKEQQATIENLLNRIKALEDK